MLAGVLTACEKSRYPVMPEQPSLIQSTNWLDTVPEVTEDATDGNARVATISPGNAVYVLMKVTGSCSSSAGSYRVAYTSGNVTGSVSTSTVKTANGYATTSIKTAKYGTWFKKKIDKTLPFSILLYNASTQQWQSRKVVAANSAVFGFIDYLKTGYSASCNAVADVNLTTDAASATTTPPQSETNHSFTLVNELSFNVQVLSSVGTTAVVQPGQTAIITGRRLKVDANAFFVEMAQGNEIYFVPMDEQGNELPSIQTFMVESSTETSVIWLIPGGTSGKRIRILIP